ncbi:cytochrome c oxidase subunit II [Coleofasciculus sp. FACHB-1120]|uniref:cytochrome c oxidase subunit II n=1 Tax=Coleofasciculus sp. FACHB-1120 TaxID=2692783 RepID=UPI0016823B84|nr:cytochrome c oxidase subunit II [Coleofasciculus sp. FACHB-1120]
MKIPSSILTLLVGIVLTLVSLWYGQNHGLLPIAASEEATLIDRLFNAMMTISTGLFLLVQGIIIIAAIRFRQRPGDDTDGPPVHGNVPLEILWTAIPAVIVLGISIYSFEVYGEIGGLNPMDHSVAHAPSHQQVAKMPGAALAKRAGTAFAATLTEAESATDTENRNQQLQEKVLEDPATAKFRKELPQLRDSSDVGVTSGRIGPTPDKQGQDPEFFVNVTGLQFAWLFSYPGTDVTAGELHLPLGREVKLNISANDVIHAFWVPEFRLKQDAVPGRQTELRFTPNRIGEYPLICAELCGAYHGVMKTTVIVQTPEDFQNWLAEQQEVASSEALDRAVAVNPAERSDAEFLAPYASEMGIDAETLHSLHHH